VRWTHVGRGLAILVLVPNAVLWLLAESAGGERALINVDYLLLGCFLPVIRRSLAVAGILTLFLLDAVLSLAPAFNFGPTSAILVLAQVRHLDGATLGLILAGVLLTVAAAMALTPRREQMPRARVVVLGCAAAVVLVLFADSVNGLGHFSRRGEMRLPLNIATSQVYRAQRAIRVAVPDAPATHGLARIPAATDSLWSVLDAGAANGGVPDRIVLVVVESFGAFESASARMAMTRRFRTDQIERRYHVLTGLVPFHGATTEAEFRELCRSASNYRLAPNTPADNCLPAVLGAHGYESVALHGYNGGLFRRSEWYPHLGFERVLFRGGLREHALPDCGVAFRGVCDAALLPVLRAEMRRHTRPQFFYWLTLSTHFPLDPRVAADAPDCSDLGAAGERALCRYSRGIWAALDVVAQLAEDSDLPPAWYIVVGDHAPPVIASGSGTFHLDSVPYVQLIPR
jgi:hypothetical protein